MLTQALLKNGTCRTLSHDAEGIQRLIAGYVQTRVEGANANAIRSHIRMDGTIT